MTDFDGMVEQVKSILLLGRDYVFISPQLVLLYVLPFQDSHIKLTVEDGHVIIPRSSLCLVSPVFDSMLNSNFKEHRNNEVHLPGKSLKTIEFIAKYVNFREPCPVQGELNTLWPGDAIWRHGTMSTLAQVMACCLMAPSHYINQCWLIINEDPWHSSQGIILRRYEDTNQ